MGTRKFTFTDSSDSYKDLFVTVSQPKNEKWFPWRKKATEQAAILKKSFFFLDLSCAVLARVAGTDGNGEGYVAAAWPVRVGQKRAAGASSACGPNNAASSFD